ncbi:MAG: hypothetical protein KA297_15670 [Kofleriaceae bacterium]|nr:hypothetical protein [Kofleriaceae bacterium]
MRRALPSWSVLVGVGVSIGAAGAPAGCTRDAAPALCPDVVAGELVVSELRGEQTGSDSQGQWIELYNASGTELDLLGLRVLWRRLDGSDSDTVLVRRSLLVAPDGYVVLGAGLDADRPSYVDYGVAGDLPGAIMPSAAVDLIACDVLIDRLTYSGLTRTGTYSLGPTPPTADGNDLSTAWCNNETVDGTGLAAPGTPGAANPPCPTL